MYPLRTPYYGWIVGSPHALCLAINITGEMIGRCERAGHPSAKVTLFPHDRAVQKWLTCNGLDQVTYLTSKHNGLVMVYDVSRPSNGPLGFRTPTYSLSPAFEANADITAFRHPSESTNRRLSFYELSRHGGIRCIETEMLESFGGGDFPEPSTTWTNEAPTTSDDTTASRDIPLLSRQAYSEINMRPVYESQPSFRPRLCLALTYCPPCSAVLDN